jgi:hypothetical protein
MEDCAKLTIAFALCLDIDITLHKGIFNAKPEGIEE